VSEKLTVREGRHACLLRASFDDATAFASFYNAHLPRVVVFFTRRVSSAELAVDLAAETFAKALEQRRQFRGRTAEEEQGWLFAIARSELARYLRRGSVQRAALVRLGIERPAMTDSEIERIEDLAGITSLGPAIAAALDGLPIEQRHAVELRVVHELEYAELARRLSVSQQVARARVSRGLRALAMRLSGDDVDALAFA